jgi:hypothetical protein
MPTLADIYSAINTAKRKGADFVQNPVTSLQQMLGNANDRARVYNQESRLAGEGMMARARGQQPTPEQLAAQQSTMEAMAGAYNPVGMMVYHGSPHLFERFSMGKIGTGEGNQAYGRGLYMAQAPEVAQEYAKNLSNTDKMNMGRLMPHANAQRLVDIAGDPKYAADDIKFVLESNPDHPQAKLLGDTLKFIESGEYKNPLANTGNFYKVDLPDTHIRRMLDWDAPLKNQPKPVRNLAKSLGMDLNDLGGDLLAKVGKGDEGKQILQNAGIPGVKYLDQASRDASTGTRNFVVFDDKHLKILERNDKPIK